ncbi:hypothetical protein TPHV1_300002 [Treponema phagedenis]|uniref:Uncharacterized protein n=1 Tax=Treponema phagedenis TaxID=162 RepID=A0A0B7H0A1_TREPH|nr:hypothetical protein TPHV1_300002 [Treponema phagedenis]
MTAPYRNRKIKNKFKFKNILSSQYKNLSNKLLERFFVFFVFIYIPKLYCFIQYDLKNYVKKEGKKNEINRKYRTIAWRLFRLFAENRDK